MTSSADEFVAIRKRSRADREEFASLSMSAKRRRIKETATERSRRAKRLREIGLTQVKTPPAPKDESKVPGPEDGYFARLGYVGAYIVNPEKSTQTEAAKEILAEDYYIVPNVNLSLPQTIKTEIRGTRKGGGAGWPNAAGIEVAHRNGINGNGVRVLVLDTGCDADHVEFAKVPRVHFRYIDPTNPRQLRVVRAFDTHGHGTHVCGIIAGQDTGIAPDVSLFVAGVIESESSRTSLRRTLQGLDWLLSEVVLHNPDKPAILNLSLGFRPQDVLKKEDTSLLVESMRSALRSLTDDFDVLTVVAAGNDGPRNLRLPGYFPEVLSVGAVDSDGKKARFSSSGKITIDGANRTVPDIYGYGVDVYSSLERDEDNKAVYAVKSGTSMATPFVTGVAALYAQAEQLRGSALRDRVLESADGNIARFERR